MRQEIISFGMAMEEKLKKNDFKCGWSSMSKQELFIRICDEIIELNEAIDKGDRKEIVQECIDIANFAMMLADNQREWNNG